MRDIKEIVAANGKAAVQGIKAGVQAKHYNVVRSETGETIDTKLTTAECGRYRELLNDGTYELVPTWAQ